MGEGSFWDNPEKAQQVIAQMKPLTGLLKPFEELSRRCRRTFRTLAELAEEDEPLEAELVAELPQVEKLLADFELRSMLSGSQDGSNAYLRIQAGAGGTEACDWAAMLLRHARTRWAERNGFHSFADRRARKRGSRYPQRDAAHRRRFRLRQSAERSRGASPGAQQSVRLAGAAADVVRGGRRPAGDRRHHRDRHQARRPAPRHLPAVVVLVGSTRTRPSRAFASRICRPASPPRAAPSAVNTRTPTTP